MLTRQDQTILDGLEVFEGIKDAGLGHVGFKDVGVDAETLRRLNGAIKKSGAISYMEVVSTSTEACLQSRPDGLGDWRRSPARRHGRAGGA